MRFKAKLKLSDYRIHHVRQWMELVDSKPDFQDIKARIRLVAIFSGLEEAILRKVDIQQVNDLFYAYTEMLARHKKRKPKGTFTVGSWWKRNRVVYQMPKDFKSYTTGQIVDVKTIENVTEDAALFLATLFIPRGEAYGDSDRSERAKVFAREYPADEFINLLAFFFESYEKRNTALLTMGLINARKKATEVLNDLKEEMKSTNG